jgi:hypothetical protein
VGSVQWCNAGGEKLDSKETFRYHGGNSVSPFSSNNGGMTAKLYIALWVKDETESEGSPVVGEIEQYYRGYYSL